MRRLQSFHRKERKVRKELVKFDWFSTIDK